MTLVLITLTAISIVNLIWQHYSYCKLKRKVIDTDQLLKNLAAGGLVYYSLPTKRSCQRCQQGKITIRRRFRVNKIAQQNVLREVTGAYSCNSCHYRGLNFI